MTPVSVIVVSRDRPELLSKTISSLRWQTHSKLEVIVVTASPHESWMPTGLSLADVKVIKFNEANISAARNLGVSAASGDVLAFVDDDAVPEPRWAERLAKAFDDTKVGAAGGYVRGRNGISFQWTAIETDRKGQDYPLLCDETDGLTRGLENERFLKVQGTNCAFRAEALRKIGGFDPAYRFYLDETDLCLRLADAGWDTSIVPLAEVQHGFAASARRSASRAPRSLYEEGRSMAYFLNAHSEGAGFDRFERDQNQRLMNYLLPGWLEPRDVLRLRQELKVGYIAGSRLAPSSLPALSRSRDVIRTFPRFNADHSVSVICNTKHLAEAESAAEAEVKDGAVVTLFHFQRGVRYHRRSFDVRGFWRQTGGLAGKSLRSDPVFTRYSIKERAEREAAFLAPQRKGRVSKEIYFT